MKEFDRWKTPLAIIIILASMLIYGAALSM